MNALTYQLYTERHQPQARRGRLPAVSQREGRDHFLDLADALGGLTPEDEKYLRSRPLAGW